MKRFFVYYIIAFLVVYSNGFALKEYDKLVKAENTSIVRIKIPDGSVRIYNAGDAEKIRIKGDIEDNIADVMITKDKSSKDTILVKPVYSKKIYSECYLKFYIPQRYNVIIETDSASVKVEDFVKQIKINSVSGEISVKSITEGLEIQTISGDINVEGGAKVLDAMSISGDVEVIGDFPIVKIKTGSGSISYEGSLLKNATLFSTSGDVFVSSKRLDNSLININTVNSTIKVTILDIRNIQYSIKSVSGSVRANQEIFTEVSGDRSEMKLKNGNGDSIIYAETISGKILIKED